MRPMRITGGLMSPAPKTRITCSSRTRESSGARLKTPNSHEFSYKNAFSDKNEFSDKNRYPRGVAPRSRDDQRAAFTLIELLVVVTIILTLTTITIVSVNFSTNADKVRAGARQIQSLLAGARDRAIYAKEIRGIRLIRDPNDNHSVNAFQYIGSPGKFSSGTLTIVAGSDGTFNCPIFTGIDQVTGLNTGTNFQTFKNLGLIKVGSRIQIPKDSGRWYTIAGLPGGEQILISQKYSDLYSGVNGPTDLNLKGSANFNRTYKGLTYLLELQPQPLPDSTPVQLPKGVVVDMDGSQVPSTWRPGSFPAAYSNQMDILYSAKGLPVGDVTSLGMIHLHVADAGDVVKWNATIDGRDSNLYVCTSLLNLPMVPADIPGNTTLVVGRDRILVTLATRTGNVVVAPVNVTNVAGFPVTGFAIDTTRIADDPFFFAETGEVASK